MTRMTGPDCVVMCNLINTHTHTHTHTHTQTHTLGVTGNDKDKLVRNSSILHLILTPHRLICLRERRCVETIVVKHSERNKHVRVCDIFDEVR